MFRNKTDNNQKKPNYIEIKGEVTTFSILKFFSVHMTFVKKKQGVE